MKKLNVLMVIVLIITFQSCTKENVSEELSNKIQLKTNSDNISEIFYKLGVEKISVKKVDDDLTYSTSVLSNIFLNGKKLDFSKFIFLLSDDKLSIKNNPKYRLSIKNGELYLESPKYVGYLKNGTDNTLIDSNSAALLLFYSEISLKITSPLKMNYSKFYAKENDVLSQIQTNGNGFRHCGSNWAVDAGFTKSSLVEEFANDLAETDFYDGCTKVGGISVSCLTDEHICFASQKYNCPC